MKTLTANFKDCVHAEPAFRRAFGLFQTNEPGAARRFVSGCQGSVYFATKDVQLEGGARTETVFFGLGNRVEQALATALRLTVKKKCELQLYVSSSGYLDFKDGDGSVSHFITFDKNPRICPSVFLETKGHELQPQDVKEFNRRVFDLHKNWPGRRTRGPMRELLEIVTGTPGMKKIRPVLTMDDHILWGPDSHLTDKLLDYLARVIKVYGLSTANVSYMPRIRIRTPGCFWFHTHITDDIMSNADLVDFKAGTFWQKGRVKASIQAIGRQVDENGFGMLVFPFFQHERIGTLQPFMLRAAYLHDQYNKADGYPPTIESANVLGSIMEMHPGLQDWDGKGEAERSLGGFRKAIEGRESRDSLAARWNELVAVMGRAISDFPHKDWKGRMDGMNGGIITI